MLQKLIEQSARKYGHKRALVFKEKEVTYSELQNQVFLLAHALKNLGLKKSDKVALYLPNSLEYVYSYLACLSLGAVVVPLDFMLKEDELTSCLNHSETRFLMALSRNEVSFQKLKSNVKSLQTIILTAPSPEASGQNFYLYSTIIQSSSNQAPNVNISDSDPALIMYTSGTTGKPKGILLNYKHLEGSPKAMEHFVDLSDRDIKLCAIPFSHIGGFIYIQNCIQFGITLVIMDRFNPLEFLKLIEKYKVTCFHIVPPMYTALLTVKTIDQFDLSRLRWVVVFGAPSSPEILERFHRYCPNAELLNGWGMTETSPPNTVTPLGSKRIESVGKPSNVCEIKIFDENDKEVSSDEVGEIVIRGPYIFAGYYKDPNSTNDMIRHGWFHTGDLGRVDEEGYLYIVGRIKEMIKVAGQIVYAPEVESVLCKHPSVMEAAVIGVLDGMRGEAVKAFVVLKEGEKLTPEEVRHFAREHLANFKVPQTIELRENLPKNRTGKIDKVLLKQEMVIL